MFCLYTLPLARPAQAKIQILTTSSRIVTILLKSLLKSLGLYWIRTNMRFIICFPTMILSWILDSFYLKLFLNFKNYFSINVFISRSTKLSLAIILCWYYLFDLPLINTNHPVNNASTYLYFKTNKNMKLEKNKTLHTKQCHIM